MSIFACYDIDFILLDLLTIRELRELYKVSSYYNELIRSNNRWIELKKFWTVDIKKIIYFVQLKGKDRLFTKACMTGSLISVKEIYNIYDIDIHTKPVPHAFRQSCIKGHIEICKWLYAMSIKIGKPFR